MTTIKWMAGHDSLKTRSLEYKSFRPRNNHKYRLIGSKFIKCLQREIKIIHIHPPGCCSCPFAHTRPTTAALQCGILVGQETEQLQLAQLLIWLSDIEKYIAIPVIYEAVKQISETTRSSAWCVFIASTRSWGKPHVTNALAKLITHEVRLNMMHDSKSDGLNKQ
jgi:hypothetical protein